MDRSLKGILVVISLVLLPSAAFAQASSGVDLAHFDRSVRPQDDMFRHVNGGWLGRTEIPADRPMYGTFVVSADSSQVLMLLRDDVSE